MIRASRRRVEQGGEQLEAAPALPTLESLVFMLAAERFALPLRDVHQVLRAVAIRSLPQAPEIVEGLIDLRGELVPVLDLRARFALSKKALAPSDHLLIAQAGARKVALRVDQALGLERLTSVDPERAPNLPRGLGLVAGVASTADGLVLIHDLRAFLSEAEALELDHALHEAATGARGDGS
jgi:purine-binding chemotaxis protein CheW